MVTLLESVKELRLPPSPIPRCGDRVCWFRGSARRRGLLLGHNTSGHGVVRSDEGADVPCEFGELRLEDPFKRVGPNWERLPATGRAYRPREDQLARFKDLLEQRTPPGPKYVDLLTEIWCRGFEVFLVGGTVRDVVAGERSNDVDLVTTMPLTLMQPLLKAMYNTNTTGSPVNGYVRIGGTPNSGDPFIDVKMFSNCFLGTANAMFGGGFDQDHAHRDFACNAVYFDAINGVLLDPTGQGVEHAQGKVLQPICATGNVRQMARIYIRFGKFLLRGFAATPEVIEVMAREYAVCLGSLKMSEKVRYLTAQVISKDGRHESVREAMDAYREQFIRIGHEAIWNQHLAQAAGRME